MRDTNLEDRLRHDAPAWRDTIATGRTSGVSTPRTAPRLVLRLMLAAAAIAAVAGLLWLQAPSTTKFEDAFAPQPISRLAQPLLTPEELADWLPRVAVTTPPLQFSDAEALATEPIRREVDRLRSDVTSAVEFMVTLVPSAMPNEPGA